MRYKTFGYSLGLAFLLAGCGDRVTSTMKGFWSADNMQYKEHEIMPCMLVNTISFSDNGKCDFPHSNNACDSIFKAPNFSSQKAIDDINNGNCKWQVLRNKPYPITLVLESDVEAYAGTHRVRFYRDAFPNQKQLMMEITGDKLHIICRRSGIINRPWEQYQKDIDELINISKGE